MSIQQTRSITEKVIPRTLSLEELRLLLEILARDPDLRDLYDLVSIISNTGIRPGELRELRWADIDFRKRQLVVHGTSYRRYIPFALKTAQILTSRRERKPNTEYILGKSPRCILRRSSHQLRLFAEVIGVDSISPYVFRRTFVIRWLQSGKSLDSLCAIAGVRTYNSRGVSHLSSEKEYEITTRYQAQLEEEL